jgi:hypothetical protein
VSQPSASPDDAQERRRLETEIAEVRAALLSAERDLARVPQLDADLAEIERLAGELRGIEADRDLWLHRYTVVVSSSSWKLTAPLRALGAHWRTGRS